MTGCFIFYLLVLKYMCFTIICAFTLNPLTTGMTSQNSHKTLGFYRLVQFIVWTPYFKLWNVRNCIVFCGGAWPFHQLWWLIIVVVIGLFFGCFHSCMGVFLSSTSLWGCWLCSASIFVGYFGCSSCLVFLVGYSIENWYDWFRWSFWNI